MNGMIVRASIGVLLVAATSAVMSAAGAATPGRTTFTQITTPGKDVLQHIRSGVVNSFPVSGRTSLDVTEVDIDCVSYRYGDVPNPTPFAGSVPVSNGQFATTATYPSTVTLPATCRLIAIPTGTDPTSGYLGRYSGPLLRTDSVAVSADPTTPYGYTAYAEEGSGVAIVHDAGECTPGTLATVALTDVELHAVEAECAFALPPANSSGAAATGSTIHVDGHNGYLPSGVHTYLLQSLSLGVTQTPLTVASHTAANGDVTITESAPVVRCSVADTYPPTTTSCPSLVSTGITCRRVTTFFRDGHQLSLRDSFTSTDKHAHRLSLQYLSATANQNQGGVQAGFVLPGHGSTFVGTDAGQSFSGFGTKAGTVLIRSDLHASANSAADDTLGETWSRAPSTVTFDGVTPDQFRTAYSLTVPTAGATDLGFALSEDPATEGAAELGALAVADVVTAPTITTPKNGVVFTTTRTTVRGALSVGANGLPTSVTVDGHKAVITAHGATSATYAVTFTETVGRHRIAVKAADAAGNVATSRTITVTNR